MATTISKSAPESSAPAGGKFLTFFLAGEEYGIEIQNVQEIIGMESFTSVPGTPDYIMGVINLRGKIIPIADLRRKFGMESKPPTSETCIVVIQAQHSEVGIVVDRVSEVLSISGSDIEPASCFGEAVNADFILGIAKSEAKITILLNTENLFSIDGIFQVRKPVRNAH
jgi:purine-binding chemotaxis protein CheW